MQILFRWCYFWHHWQEWYRVQHANFPVAPIITKYSVCLIYFFQEPNKREQHFETIPNTGPISRKKPIIIEWMEKIFDLFPLFFRYLPKVIPFFQTPKKHWLFCVSNISSINFNCDAFLGLLLDQSWSDKR